MRLDRSDDGACVHLDRSTIVRTRADSRLVPTTKHHKTNFPLPVCFTAGGYGAGDPPDPIPNSEVKTRCADGTAGATRWESTAPPAYLKQTPASISNDRSGRLLFLQVWASEDGSQAIAEGSRSGPHPRLAKARHPLPQNSLGEGVGWSVGCGVELGETERA